MDNKRLDQLRGEVAAGPPYPARLMESLRTDARAGGRALYRTCLRRRQRATAEQARLAEMTRFERAAMANGFTRVAGVDEAGRGPVAGPIMAAAVILAHPVEGVADSKQLSAAQRETLFDVLEQGGHAIGVAAVDADTIDRVGIQLANYAAMARAVAALEPAADFLLVDGFTIRGVSVPQNRLIKGDCRSLSIAAASIVAKVVRDRAMAELDAQYPQYRFVQNKGYATRAHLAALSRFGPCRVHRKSFAPIAYRPETGALFAD